jgi:hypothetical protein
MTVIEITVRDGDRKAAIRATLDRKEEIASIQVDGEPSLVADIEHRYGGRLRIYRDAVSMSRLTGFLENDGWSVRHRFIGKPAAIMDDLR